MKKLIGQIQTQMIRAGTDFPAVTDIVLDDDGLGVTIICGDVSQHMFVVSSTQYFIFSDTAISGTCKEFTLDKAHEVLRDITAPEVLQNLAEE